MYSGSPKLIADNLPPTYHNYFPVSEQIGHYLAEKAKIQRGINCLETSAGTGHLARVLRNHGATVSCYELFPQFQVQLIEQGFEVLGSNFLTETLSNRWSRIVQNPPFNLQVSFVRKAYTFLKPGGILVSLHSDTPWIYHQQKYREFRAWLKLIDAQVEELPYGLFLNSDRPCWCQCYCLKVVK